MTDRAGPPRQLLGRYVLFDELASGGMATVHLGRLLGPVGFAKTVAIKRLHPHLARDPEFVSMFIDEARVAARIRHPNVVSTLDVVPLDGELFLVLDYVEGESLSHLIKAARRKKVRIEPRIAAAIIANALHGLHAAHEATDEHGMPLGIVHRDVSPQNILVGGDGVARVLDFGVAKAAGRMQETQDGQLKGKLSYMAPEQVEGGDIDRRTDVYAASVVLWETFTGTRLVSASNEGLLLQTVLRGNFPRPSTQAPWLPRALDAMVMRGLERDPANRYPTALEMAIELERAAGAVASQHKVGAWVAELADAALAVRAARVKEMESSSAVRVVDAGAFAIEDLPAQDRTGSEITASSVSSPTAGHTATSGVAGHARRPPPGTTTLVMVAAAMATVLFLGVLALVALYVVRTGDDSTASATSPPLEAARGAVPEVAEEERSEPAPAPPPVPATATPEPAPAPHDPPVAPSAAVQAPRLAAPRAPPAPVPRPPAPKPAAKGSCDPPFYFDAAGVKHFKPECL